MDGYAEVCRLLSSKNAFLDNLEAAQQLQKSWYDKRARERHFQEGDDDLVLLPTSSSKLETQWQGPYKVLKKVSDVTYVVHMHNKRKGKRTFHVNLLKKWHSTPDTSCLAQEFDTDVSDDIVGWKSGEPTEPSFGKCLTPKQTQQLQHLLTEFSKIRLDTLL